MISDIGYILKYVLENDCDGLTVGDITRAQRQLEDLEVTIESLGEELLIAEETIAVKEEEISNLENEMAAMNDEIEDLRRINEDMSS